MTLKFARFARALLCCTALPAALLPVAALAAPASWTFDLKAAPLGKSIAAFTRTTGVIVVADASLTRGKTGAAVNGAFGAEAALSQLLSGTGLRAQSDNRGGFVLVRDAGPAAQAIEAEAEVMVYGRRSSDTARTIPQSVQVLDGSLLRSPNNRTVGDVLRYVAGASRDGSPLDTFGDTYLVRGFASNQTVNGLSAGPLNQARDTVSIERVEVLKGPTSVLYGQLQPGAVINIVTKQPKRQRETGASLTLGRFNDVRATVDTTGPIANDGDARFRLTAAYDDADSFVDHWHRRHLFVSPVFAMDLSNATTFTLETLYTRNELDGFFNGLPAEGTILSNPNGAIDRSLGLTDPTFEPSIRQNTDVTARIDHRFANGANWRTALSWTNEKVDEEGVFGLLGWEDDDKRLLTRAVLTSWTRGDTWTAHSDVSLAFDTGSIGHDLVFGGDYTWFDRENASALGLAASLDVYAPVYETSARPDTSPVPSFGSTTEESTRTAGLFAQDRITLTDTLKVVAGVRYSDYSQETVSARGGGAAVTDSQDQTAWTSQLGLLYTPSDTVSWFANRTTSFLPVQGTTAAGDPLKPETGTQYEVGARARLLEGRLALDGALFHLERGNVAVSDRDSPSALIAIGAQVAKGIELSARYRLSDAASIYAGYAYTDASTTEDTNDALVGKRIRNIPEHSLVVRSDYRVQTGPAVGLTLGAAATYTGKRAGDIDDSFELPGFWRTDLQAEYPLTETVTVGVSVENLTDERYYSHAFSQFEVWPGAPRTWRVTLATRF